MKKTGIQNGLKPVNNAKNNNNNKSNFHVSFRAKKRKKGKTALSLWMNSVMTTDDRDTLIYF